jgi:hypothetical protein
MTLQLHHLHTDGPKPLYKKITADEYERLTARIDELERMDTEHTLQIAKMNGYIHHLEEERRWRKFSEEKPEQHQWILVFYPNHSQFTTGVELRRWDDGCKYDVEVQEIFEKWRPLPSAPKETK